MDNYYSNNTYNNFEDVSFIGGTDFVIKFPFYSNGAKHNITGFSAKWFLAPYGQPDVRIAELDCESIEDNTFYVTIPESLTLSLSGGYIHQLKIVNPEGRTIRVGQGNIFIRQAIPSLYD